MSDSGSVSGSVTGSAAGNDVTRVKGVTIVKPILYGSSSQPFGKKREPDGHTHEWTIYVTPPGDETILLNCQNFTLIGNDCNDYTCVASCRQQLYQ